MTIHRNWQSMETKSGNIRTKQIKMSKQCQINRQQICNLYSTITIPIKVGQFHLRWNGNKDCWNEKLCLLMKRFQDRLCLKHAIASNAATWLLAPGIMV